MEKYNPIWLKSKHFHRGWHNRQLEFFKQCMKDCENEKVMFAINSPHYIEAWLPELIKYEFSARFGILTVYK